MAKKQKTYYLRLETLDLVREASEMTGNSQNEIIDTLLRRELPKIIARQNSKKEARPA